jgi:hypothetical protein
MSTFFKVFQDKTRGKQPFSKMLTTVFALINAQPVKNIGFCIVTLVGQVIIVSNGR